MKKYKELYPYYKKVLVESIIKSALLGLMIGFGMVFVLSAIFYFVKFDGLLITIILGSISAIAGGLLLYFLKLKPSIKEVARRLDQLGLQERNITMLELEGNDSYIAEKQRMNTQEVIVTVSPKMIKFKHLTKVLVSLVAVAIVSLTMVFVLAQEIHAINQPKIDDPIIEEPSDEDKIINELIQKLRDIVNNAEVSQTLKDDLHILIDKLEVDLKEAKTTLEKIAMIEATRIEILARIDAAIVKHIVTFDSNGGSAVGQQIVVEGKSAKEPNSPTKDGFMFDYWYATNPALAFDFKNTKITTDITLTAAWADYYTITFNSNGGSEVKPQNVAEGKFAKQPKNPTKNGYVFVHWYIADAFVPFDFKNTPITADMTLNAAWGYVVSFDSNGGTPVKPQNVVEGGTAVVPDPKPYIENKIFVHWYLDDPETEFDFSTPITEAITLIALYRDPEFGEEPDEAPTEPQDPTDPEPSDDPTEEEQLADDIDDAIQDAIDELTGQQPNPDPDPDDGENGGEEPDENGEQGNNNGEDGSGWPNDSTPTVIDGQTSYIQELQNLKAQLEQLLLNSSLTDAERNAINNYIENIDAEINNAD